MNQSPQALKKLVRSVNLISNDELDNVNDKIDTLPENAIDVTYKKISDSKNKIDSLYMSIALRYDPNNVKLVSEVINTIQKLNKK